MCRQMYEESKIGYDFKNKTINKINKDKLKQQQNCGYSFTLGGLKGKISET